MNRPALSLALGATLLATVMVAHAAPSSPAPAPTPTLKPAIPVPVPVVNPLSITVDVQSGTVKCSEVVKVTVKLTLKAGEQGWHGSVTLLAAGGSKMVGADISPIPGPLGSPRLMTVQSTNPLDCTKALGAFEVRVDEPGRAGGSLKKALKFTTLKAEQGFTPPPSSDLAPWLRRVTLNGTCGGTITGTVGLHTFSPQPKPAKVKLVLGTATKEETVQVQTTNTFVSVEAPLDCQGGKFPALDYALLDGHPNAGKLASFEIGFVE
jgi:hypothetical protein